MKKLFTHTLLALAATLAVNASALAQVAGGTTTATAGETTRIAPGWSVKKTLMGKTIYNEAGDKVGEVEDLIIDPARNLSYVIVGAGGFIGIGQHDVAVPVAQIQDRSGRLVMPGATKDALKAMAKFEYADTNENRAEFIASAERDIAKAKTAVTDLGKRAATANTQTRVKIDGNLAAVQGEVQSAEASLGKLKQASAARWKEFEADVAAATARLRKSVDTAAG